MSQPKTTDAHLRAALNYRARRKAEGRCVQCGKPAAKTRSGKIGTYCQTCRDKSDANNARYRGLVVEG